MKISIHSNDSIKKIKEKFHSRFPNLKIEFFKKPHEVGKGSPKKDMITEDVLLKDLSDKVEGEIIFTPEMKISEFEQIWEDFGLHIQVFYRATRVWLETITSDHRTLDEANHYRDQIFNAE